MMQDKDLEQYRRTLEQAVAGSGRDDIGIGKVTESQIGKSTRLNSSHSH